LDRTLNRSKEALTHLSHNPNLPYPVPMNLHISLTIGSIRYDRTQKVSNPFIPTGSFETQFNLLHSIPTGVVDPLEIKSNEVLQHMGRQWERVPGRETAWRLRKGSYLWLPGNEVAFPKVNYPTMLQ
jgi:hypothetical protein